MSTYKMYCSMCISRRSTGESPFSGSSMSRLAVLKQATSLSDLAALLGFKPKAVSYILYKQPQGSKYTPFKSPREAAGSE